MDGLSWITRVPLTITLGNKQYIDNQELDCNALIQDMAASPEAPHSACPSPGDYMDTMDTGADDVYVVTLSDKLSGSYSSASSAAQILLENGCRSNIHVFNSKSAAACQVSICLKLRELAESGLTFISVVSQVEQYISEQTTLFVLETLDVFRKNGRLSHLQAIITSAIRIKMVMCAEKDGTVGIRGKALTTAIALKKMAEIVIRDCTAETKDRVLVITHVNCPDRAEQIRASLVKSSDFIQAIICRAGGISTIYANNGGIILSY